MMKVYKKISLLLCALLIASFALVGCGEHVHNYVNWECSCGEMDPNRETSGLTYTELEDGTMEVSNYGGSDQMVYIPEVKDGKTVTSIGEHAFEGVPTVKSIKFPNTLTHIKAYAFNACSALRSIVIPENVKYIGADAFAYCSDVMLIKYNAINCEHLTTSDLPFRLVGSNRNEVELIIGRKVQVIPNDLFYGYNYLNNPYLTSVVFEDNSECIEIGDHAFMHCRSLKTFDLGANSKLQRIGDSCFGNCVSLQNFFVPKTVRVIEKYAFGITTAMQTLVFEDPTGWCVRKFELYSWSVLYYKELTTEQMTNGLAMVNYYNSMFFSKIEDTSPNWSGPHYHEFENGVCRCWFVNSDHVHIYDNGVCACKDVTSEHIHDYNEEGICACKATNDKHSHNFNSEMCNCGAYYNDVVG